MTNTSYINAAFPSSKPYQVYFFVKNKFVRLYYTPGATGDEILTPLELVSSGFSSLAGTVFAEQGIQCSFNTEETKAYIFSGKNCAHIDYAPNTGKDKILEGPSKIAQMFPDLKNTVFSESIDAAFRSTRGKEVYLFKGHEYCCINYDTKKLVGSICNISDGFPVLKGTIFENGFDASFTSYNVSEAYLFKGDEYVRLKFTPGDTRDTLVGDVNDILDGWPCLRGTLPVNF